MSTKRKKVKPRVPMQDDSMNNLTPLKSTDNVKPGRVVADKLSDFCFHVAELIIGGVILAGLMNQDLDYMLLSSLGFMAVVLFVAIGIYFASVSYKTDD